jgi:pimeloyl-ACP methyl ester carboxylesterase
MPTVGIDGTRFYYEERGKGPPLLLIHGNGGNTSMLAVLAQRLSSSYRVITYDRRGFTQTATLPAQKKEYLRKHADDAAALLRELGAPRAAVFGWSMGGVVALALALHHPKVVSSLVLYDAPLYAKKHWNLRMARKLGGVVALAKVGMHERAAARFFRYALTYDDGGNGFDELDATMQKSALANARTIIAEVDAGTGEDLPERELARLSLPIGLIGGGRSAPFLRAAVDRCAKLFPTARVMRIPDGDHMMAMRKPSVLARAIEDLLKCDPTFAAPT